MWYEEYKTYDLKPYLERFTSTCHEDQLLDVIELKETSSDQPFYDVA